MTATLTTWRPTTEDLEAVITARRGGDRADILLEEAIAEYDDNVDHTVPEDDDLHQGDEPHQLWRDLRPSQAARLHQLTEQAKERAFAAARKAIMAELLMAAGSFASEHPEATRGEGGAS